MGTRPIYSTVSFPYWPEVWIVAGGPSARRFDFGKLKNKRVLCVNESILSLLGANLAFAPSVFSLDHHWVYRRRDFLAGHQGEKFVSLPLETWPECDGIPRVTYLRHSTEQGLSDNPGVIHGLESGYGAINLAYLKRAREIHLVGYDMDPAENEKWGWWLPRYGRVAVDLAARGVKVVNHNLLSHVEAFEKAA